LKKTACQSKNTNDCTINFNKTIEMPFFIFPNPHLPEYVIHIDFICYAKRDIIYFLKDILV